MVGPSSQISKLLLTILFLLIIFYAYMDVQLYLRIQNYPIERSIYLNSTTKLIAAPAGNYVYIDTISGSIHKTTISVDIVPPAVAVMSSSSSTAPVSDKTMTPSSSSLVTINSAAAALSYENSTWITCAINPLCHVTVKAIMLDHTNHYIFAPMATVFDDIVGFSRSTFITANMISFFHVFVAIAAGRLVASDCLGYRRFGVVLFQFRTFLDDLDGHVARTKKHVRGERSEIGTTGYYIDGICDGLGCIALMIGITFFLKNNPPRRGYTQLQAILPTADSKNSDAGIIYKVKVTTKKVARKVLCFSGQLLLSSTAWNRYIALYQDMLERTDVAPAQFYRQNSVFRSNWFFCVAWLWRVFNVHALLHCVLLSIFCDKLWDFLCLIQYTGYVVLLVCICATEMHVLEVQNFIFNSLTGNYTSL